ncbi:MAG: hypothetical protein JSW61_13855 [Candidatus Thorarchaeota archaeon]|nr:MAG: hypothetical protein JSW61_13855 [Candidatus Thorarchaeota archaeon]
MYVKIRTDGALGIGRGTEGKAEIAIGYGEAHMIAAALEKLAQTARSYRQTYRKTTDVGAGNKIDFERADDGRISLIGDGQQYYCTEEEIRELAEKLKHLPPVEVAPASDYVEKAAPKDGFCVLVKNGGKQIKLKLPDAALVKAAVKSSLDSRFFEENIKIGDRTLAINRSSDLKWSLSSDNESVRFTAYEVEALLAGLHNTILDVLMDAVKSKGSDKIADIRVKSQIQRIEQEATKVLAEHSKGKGIIKQLTKVANQILGTGTDADARAHDFIRLCNYIHSKLEPEFLEPLFEILSFTLVTDT